LGLTGEMQTSIGAWAKLHCLQYYLQNRLRLLINDKLYSVQNTSQLYDISSILDGTIHEKKLCHLTHFSISLTGGVTFSMVGESRNAVKSK
jgi:hypothetical protein